MLVVLFGVSLTKVHEGRLELSNDIAIVNPFLAPILPLLLNNEMHLLIMLSIVRFVAAPLLVGLQSITTLNSFSFLPA